MAHVNEPATGTVDRLAVERFVHQAWLLEGAVGQVIVGQREVVRQVLIALLGGGHVLLEGVPGLGKTLLVRALGEALDLRFSRIQFTPDLMPADIVGTMIVHEEESGRRLLQFQPGPVFAHLVLADEINRATPKTQSALLEAMQEHQVSVGDSTRRLPEPFFVLATQNPLEMEGTYPLPEAQLDRFFFKVLVPFPPAGELSEILRRSIRYEAPRAEQVTTGPQVLEMLRTAREVPVAAHVAEYAVRLVYATHPDQAGAPGPVRRYVRYGASPRGLQALVIGGQVRALLEGRYNVAVDDLRAVAKPALRHRILLNFEAHADNVNADSLLEQILANV
jgi:MoxR-like ATPase